MFISLSVLLLTQKALIYISICFFFLTVSGIRCQDMRLRLKYVDIPAMLSADVENAICERMENGCGNLYVLVNYTALFSTRVVLKKLEERK